MNLSLFIWFVLFFSNLLDSSFEKFSRAIIHLSITNVFLSFESDVDAYICLINKGWNIFGNIWVLSHYTELILDEGAHTLPP